jgi:DNA-directed RNA polymerase subunit E'/Rpb7
MEIPEINTLKKKRIYKKRENKPLKKIIINEVDEPVIEPVVLDNEPVVLDNEPVVLDNEPVVLDNEPIVLDNEPVVLDNEPVVLDNEPVVLDNEPVVLDNEPVVLDNKLTNTIKKKKRINIIESIYEKALLTKNINIEIKHIGKNFNETLEKILKEQFEGKCIVEGYIKNDSIQIINYSSGVMNSSFINYEVVFECLICFPVEGMIINCRVKNITKAGIRSESSKENPSPFVLFISRDHHIQFNNTYFNSLKMDDIFKAKIIGQRFELNDKKISIIGELVQPTQTLNRPNKELRRKLVLES